MPRYSRRRLQSGVIIPAPGLLPLPGFTIKRLFGGNPLLTVCSLCLHNASAGTLLCEAYAYLDGNAQGGAQGLITLAPDAYGPLSFTSINGCTIGYHTCDLMFAGQALLEVRHQRSSWSIIELPLWDDLQDLTSV